MNQDLQSCKIMSQDLQRKYSLKPSQSFVIIPIYSYFKQDKNASSWDYILLLYKNKRKQLSI